MSFQTRQYGEVVYHTSTVLDHERIRHGFSTRLGGVSGGRRASLNLRSGGPEPDARENVQENYRRFCAAAGVDPAGLVLSKQVHGDTVRHVTGADRGKGFLLPADYTADALVTDEPGLNLTVFSADCIILLFHDPVTRSIGAVHAGWRGTALDLPAKTVRELGRLFGARPADIRVAIGVGVSDVRAELAEYAKQFLGNPYVYGGTSLTKGTDCSGFVMRVFEHFNVSLPRTSGSQSNSGTKISESDLLPGDLIFYAGKNGVVNHVALYIGNGQVIHASSPETGIKISQYKYRTPVKYRRVLED